MTNNNNNNNEADGRQHSNSHAAAQPQAPHKKQAVLLQRKKQLKHEPWLFQSLNFQPSPLSLSSPSSSPSLPTLGSNGSNNSSSSGSALISSASALSMSPLSKFSDFSTSTPFFLDADALKGLMARSAASSSARCRPKSSGHAYGSVHQQNNTHQQMGRGRHHHHHHHHQRHVHPPAAPARLEALSGSATARRRKTKRIGGKQSASRKYALRVDGIKGRPSSHETTKRNPSKAKAHKPDHQRHRHGHKLSKGVERKSSYHDEALAYNSDDEYKKSPHDPPVTPLEDLDEEKRQKMVIAAQLNLTLEEYEALDAAFGDRGKSKRHGEDDDDEDGSMTSRYFETFTQYDVDGSGAISPDELRRLLQASGEDMDDAELATVIKQADTDHDGEIDFDEFIGLMRARKRLLRVANQMGVTGTGPAAASAGSSNNNSSSSHLALSPSTTSLSSPTSHSSLPPLKMATLQSKKHLQQFNAHFTRPTPTCLRPGAQVDLTQLRRELAISEFGIQELNTKVREGLHWVQQHCPVRSLKAQIFCHRWGMEKVQQLFLRIQSQALSRAFQKWIAFRMYEKNKLKANMFLKCKGSQKMTEIMTKWRRKVTRRKFSKWKTECLIDARNELQCAAIELQRIIRGKLARLELVRLRRKAAAIRIQSLVRGHLGRCLVLRKRRAQLEHESACLLQRCYRGYNGKRVGRALFKAQQEGLAARRIQRAFKNHQRRELLRVIQQTKFEHDCAIQLQCCVRSHLARRERSRRAMDKKRMQSSIIIQRHARGLLARRRVTELRRQQAAAVTIQCTYRAFRSRFRVYLMRKGKELSAKNAHERMSATKIQARWRCFHYRKLYLKERLQRAEAQRVEKLLRLTSAMKIQSAYRGYRARRVAQRARYEKLKWMNFTIMNRSALKIQSFWRGYHGRLASHLRLQAKRALEYEENEAAKRIQLIAKGKLARGEKRKRVQQQEQTRLFHQKRTKAALRIQKVYRGKKARRIVAKLNQEHRDEARRALERLVDLTKTRAAVKIQCCVRRFLSRVRYLTKQKEAQRRRQLEEQRLVQAHAAIVIQCAMRRAKAQQLLLLRRRDFERRISMMASEKAHDEIERLRKEQEEELLKLKLQLMYQQDSANAEAAKLRGEVARQRAEEEQRREAEAQELARLKVQTLMQQQSERRLLEIKKTQETERLREKLENEKQAQEQMEAAMRTRENEELTRLKLATLLESNAQSQKQQQETNVFRHEAKQLQNAALAIQREQAKLKIQAICLKYIAKRRIDRLQQTQALQMASLKDGEERVRLKAVQEKEIALARLKAIMDDEARAREQEIQALEMQMLERARKEKERIATRNAAASRIQSLVRGYLGRQRVKAIQDKIEKEREARAKAIEATLAEVEAKVAEALSADASAIVEEEPSDEWVEYWDENAQASYFYNIRTQEASWTRPVSASAVSSKALEIALAATTPTVDHEEDSYANYGSEAAVDEHGYPLGAGRQGYADPYGYYDQYGQYHYYEENPGAAANANAGAYSGAQMMRGAAGMYPGYASLYAYQAAMASMMFGFANPMMQQQFANPMMQQQFPNPMMLPTPAAPTDTVAEDAAAPPDPWEKFVDQYTGAAYYYNNITGEKYWA